MSTWCSKHVEAWNKLIVKQKFCTSSWLITEINILRCTVSKTSKLYLFQNITLFLDLYYHTPTHLPIQWIPGHFPGSKVAWTWCWPPYHHIASRLKSTAIPVLPLWAFVACFRMTFTFSFHLPPIFTAALLTFRFFWEFLFIFSNIPLIPNSPPVSQLLFSLILTADWAVSLAVASSWNVMAHGDAREGKWRVNWWMQWVASTLHTTSEHGVSSITTADAHTSVASSRLNWLHSGLF